VTRVALKLRSDNDDNDSDNNDNGDDTRRDSTNTGDKVLLTKEYFIIF